MYYFDLVANRSSGEFPKFEPVEAIPNLGAIDEPSKITNRTGSLVFIAAISIFAFWFLKKSPLK